MTYIITSLCDTKYGFRKLLIRLQMLSNPSKEIGLIAALTCEASPIIRALDLKPVSKINSFSLYKGEGITLIISGIGSENSAAATNYLMGHNPGIKALINFGICGATQDFKKNCIVTPSKILNISTGQTYYPEILVKGGALGTLATADEPVTSAITDVDFYDMEGAGIFTAGLRYLAPSRISIIKVVSDNLTDLPQTKDEVTAIINAAKEHLISFIKIIQKIPIHEPNLLDDELQLIEKIKVLGRLTVTQERQLSSISLDFKYRGGDLSLALKQFSERTNTLRGDSASRDIFFSKIVNVLKSV